MTDFAHDIPLQLAQAAHAGTSHVPERRGEQEVAGYVATLQGDLEALTRYATTDAKRALLAEEFARYRQGYRRRFIAYLGARGACVSTMITGASNFNVGRAQRRSASADKRTADLLEFRERALAAIRKALTPELQPIQLGDADAAERLEARIAKLEQRQALMKAANAAIRKHAKAGADAQVVALVALGLSEGTARELLKPDCLGRIGFADYEVKNNNANIRRLKSRIVAVETAQATESTVLEGESGSRVEVVPAENRIRVYFPGRPSRDVCAHLKANGFRWAPSQGCWSAYNNHHSLVAARAVCGVASSPVQAA